MTIQAIRDAVQRHAPITLKLSSGEQIIVPHQDFLFFAPPVAGQVIIAVEATGRFHILDATQIIGITVEHVAS